MTAISLWLRTTHGFVWRAPRIVLFSDQGLFFAFIVSPVRQLMRHNTALAVGPVAQ
jgi:hypothetical protein